MDVRLAAALELVQTDLDACELVNLTLELVDVKWREPDFTVYCVGLAGYGCYAGPDNLVHYPTNSQVDAADLISQIAASAQDTLAETVRVIWPTCSKHGDRMCTVEWFDSVTDTPAAGAAGAAWWCDGVGGHRLTYIGQLAQVPGRKFVGGFGL